MHRKSDLVETALLTKMARRGFATDRMLRTQPSEDQFPGRDHSIALPQQN